MMRGDPRTLSRLAATLRSIRTTTAQKIAARAAPVLTAMAQAAYSGGTTVYGDGRPAGVAGNALTLRDTGTVQGSVRFAAIGTIVRAVLSTRYARYLVGKYLPMGAMPVRWSEELGRISREECARALEEAA